MFNILIKSFKKTSRIKLHFPIFVFIIVLFSTTIFASSDSRVVRVGVFQNPPIVFQNEKGEAQGLYVDLLKKVASKENWKIIFFLDTFSNNLKKIKSEKIDLMTSIAYTKEREGFLEFSKETIWTFWGVVYAQKKLDIHSIIELNDRKIAIMKRGVFGKSFRKLCSDFNINCIFTETASQDQSLELLYSQDVDAAIFNNTYRLGDIGKEKIQKTPILFSPLKAYYATLKGKNTDLLAKIDSYMKIWKNDSNSIYYQSINRWTGQQRIITKKIPRWLKLYLPSSIFVILFILLWVTTLKIQIKKRRDVEKKLREDEKKFRSLSEASFEGIIISEKGKILEANRAISEMYGYTIPELLRKKAIDLVPKELQESVHNKILSEYEKPYESMGLKKDGSTFSIEVHGRMFPDKEYMARITAIRDISAQKKIENELRTSAAIFENLVEGIYLTSLEDLTIKWANPMFEKMFGYDRGELIGKQIDMINAPTDVPLSEKRKSIIQILEKTGEWHGEVQNLKKDGTHFWCFANVSLFDHMEYGKVIVSIHTDITERKNAEKELKAALDSKDMLMKEIHHRVKNNLQIIQSLVSIQAMSISNEAKDYLDKVENRIKTIAMIHERLYQSNELSHIEASEYFQSLASQIYHSINISPSMLNLKVDVLEIYLDVNIIVPCGLIINELVTNAFKHAFPNDEEGEVLVKFSHGIDDTFVLSVKDNGVGLPEGFSLEQLQSLGLTVVTSLTRQIKGNVQVISDKGTEFRISFKTE